MKRFLRKGKKEGSVLFTVVSVMMVMVVFLMSTMVLSASANRRSYYSYYETQAQYAAQAALDAVTNSAYTEEDFYKWVCNNTAGGSTATVNVSFNGSDIQFTNGNSTVVCQVEKADRDVMVWDELTQAVHKQTAYKITATASVGAGRNQTDYTVCNYIYENFRIEDESKLPTPYNVSNNTLHNWTRITNPPGPSPVTGGSLNKAVYSLASTDTSNNVSYFGPQYSGMQDLPLGRINYVSAGLKTLSNDNRAVGNVVTIASIYNEVLKNCVFESYGEGAQFYGDIVVKNKGNNAGYYFGALINDTDRAVQRNYNQQPYVYVDGMVGSYDHDSYDNNNINVNIGGQGGGVYVGSCQFGEGNNNVNMYCGGICFPSGTEFQVLGDLYMYDPDLYSVWRSMDTTMWGNTAVYRFVSNNINKADTKLADNYAVGGNIICNNKYFDLGAGSNNGGMTINGNLIFTNPEGTLNISNTVHVNGSVLCAGTLEGRGNLDCGDIHVASEEPDFYEKYGDPTYAEKRGWDYAEVDLSEVGYHQALMPFELRIDEIFDQYWRWDLQRGTDTDAINASNADRYVAESMACGHDWSVGQAGNKWVTHTTTALKGKNFIEHFIPSTDRTLTTAGYDWTDRDAFTGPGGATLRVVRTNKQYTFEKLTGNIPGEWTQEQKDNLQFIRNNYHTGVPIVYHDKNGTLQTKSVNALVIKDSCVLNLEGCPSNVVILIDPHAGGHSDSNPLRIVLEGSSNNESTIVVNNTCGYNEDYSSYTPYAASGTKTTYDIPGRREVYLFMADGYGGSGGTGGSVVMSGSYGMFTSGEWYVVSNPLYPTHSDWANVDAAFKYAYEVVPNTVIFGQAGKTFTFMNGAHFNAELILPESGLRFPTTSNIQAKMNYREYSNSITYYAKDNVGDSNPKQIPIFGTGTILCKEISTSSNHTSMAYIGDGMNPNAPTPPTEDSDDRTESSQGKDRLGQENVDYFNNDHLGAS